MGRETEALRACPAAPNPFADIGLAAAGQVSPPCSSATSGHPRFLETCWQPISVPLWLSKGMLFPLLSISACCWGCESGRGVGKGFAQQGEAQGGDASVCLSICLWECASPAFTRGGGEGRGPPHICRCLGFSSLRWMSVTFEVKIRAQLNGNRCLRTGIESRTGLCTCHCKGIGIRVMGSWKRR